MNSKFDSFLIEEAIISYQHFVSGAAASLSLTIDYNVIQSFGSVNDQILINKESLLSNIINSWDVSEFATIESDGRIRSTIDDSNDLCYCSSDVSINDDGSEFELQALAGTSFQMASVVNKYCAKNDNNDDGIIFHLEIEHTWLNYYIIDTIPYLGEFSNSETQTIAECMVFTGSGASFF